MGAFEETKGKVKEKVGEWTDNPDLEREGEAQKDKGEAEREATQGQGQGQGPRGRGRGARGPPGSRRARRSSRRLARTAREAGHRARPRRREPARGARRSAGGAGDGADQVGEVDVVDDAGDATVARVPARPRPGATTIDVEGRAEVVDPDVAPRSPRCTRRSRSRRRPRSPGNGAPGVERYRSRRSPRRRGAGRSRPSGTVAGSRASPMRRSGTRPHWPTASGASSAVDRSTGAVVVEPSATPSPSRRRHRRSRRRERRPRRRRRPGDGALVVRRQEAGEVLEEEEEGDHERQEPDEVGRPLEAAAPTTDEPRRPPDERRTPPPRRSPATPRTGRRRGRRVAFEGDRSRPRPGVFGDRRVAGNGGTGCPTSTAPMMMRCRAEYFGWHDVSVSVSSIVAGSPSKSQWSVLSTSTWLGDTISVGWTRYVNVPCTVVMVISSPGASWSTLAERRAVRGAVPGDGSVARLARQRGRGVVAGAVLEVGDRHALDEGPVDADPRDHDLADGSAGLGSERLRQRVDGARRRRGAWSW